MLALILQLLGLLLVVVAAAFVSPFAVMAAVGVVLVYVGAALDALAGSCCCARCLPPPKRAARRRPGELGRVNPPPLLRA